MMTHQDTCEPSIQGLKLWVSQELNCPVVPSQAMNRTQASPVSRGFVLLRRCSERIRLFVVLGICSDKPCSLQHGDLRLVLRMILKLRSWHDSQMRHMASMDMPGRCQSVGKSNSDIYSSMSQLDIVTLRRFTK